MTTSHFVWSRYTRHVPSRLRAGLLGFALVCFAPSLVWAQFNVDNPQDGDIVTGNVAINGFHCMAAEMGIRVQFDDFPPGPISLTERADIVRPLGPCDDLNDGFILNFNWALLAPGRHTLLFYLGDEVTAFEKLTVTVVHVEPGTAFFRGGSGECVGTVSGPGGFSTNVRAEWNETLQNVSIVETDVDICPSDMVEVGPLCVDKYEASVWSDTAGTGTQYGDGVDDYPCSDNGNDCGRIFAVSLKGAMPSRFLTWFQAQQACANVGKRLLTNAEWQMAAAGTPDPADAMTAEGCNTNEATLDLVGARNMCVSRWGAYDMVGNVWEWVGDWIQDNSDVDGGSTSTALYENDGIFGVDESNPEASRFPAAVMRGGNYLIGSNAGVFALHAGLAPSFDDGGVGLRCGRSK